jgi:hypothetical protein
MLPIAVSIAALLGVVPLTLDARGLPVVDVSINGRGPYAMVVDTAATTTMLDDGIASALGLAASGRVIVTTVTGDTLVDAGALRSVSIGGLEVRDLPVTWMSLARMRQGRGDLAGVIGQDVLSRATVTLDYARRQLRVGRGTACGAGDVRVPVAWADGRPMIEARLDAPGIPPSGTLVLDSAADALLLFRSAPHDQRLPRAEVAVAAHHGTLGAAAIPRVTLSIAGVRLTRSAVLLPIAGREEDGLLPASWFGSVCIDGPRSEAVFTGTSK